MNRHYQPITTVTFRHNYYADEVCGDLVVKPCADTASLLPKYRLQWGVVNKHRPSTYQLLQEQYETTLPPNPVLAPLIPLPTAFLLRFELYLTHPSFLNFTDLPRLESREIYYFENQANGIDLIGNDYRKVELVADHVQLFGLPLGADVTVFPPDGSASWIVPGYDEGGFRHARVDLEKKVGGLYQLNWTGNPEADKEVYRDANLIGKGLFGLLHLQVSTVPALDISGNSYVLQFMPKQARWQYFLMLKNAPHTGAYSITNANVPDNGNFSFLEHPDGVWDSDIVAYMATLQATSNGATIKAFTSDTTIPYRDVARSSIRLLRSGATNPVVSDLPNPAAGAANASVVVLVDKPL